MTLRSSEIHIEAVKEGWDGPDLTPAKVVVTTRHVAPPPAVPEKRAPAP